MTAQIERNPREGVELNSPLRRVLAWLRAWVWARREGLAMIVCYGIVYALAVAITTQDPVYIGLAAFLGGIAAIVGFCIEQATSPGAHL